MTLNNPSGGDGRVVLRHNDSGRAGERRYAADLVRSRLNLDGALGDEREAPEGLHLTPGVVVSLSELDELFDIVTLNREIKTGRRDGHGRFDDRAAIWDCSAPEIGLRIQGYAARLNGVSPKADGFHVIFSHDVDRVTFTELTSIVKTCSPMRLARRGNAAPVSALLEPGLIVRRIKELLALENEYGVHAWYFMLAGPYGIVLYSTRYDIKWPHAREIVHSILDAGAHIGLHGSYRARERDSYGREAEALSAVAGHPIVCHRNHYLRFDPQNGWRQIRRAGMKYDFSVGYHFKQGFRSGMTGPYPLYDLANSEPVQLLEIPLVFMERPQHLFNTEESMKELRSVLTAAKDVGGYVSVQIHPERFAINREWFGFYRRMIEMCLEMGADVSGTLPAEAGGGLPC